MQLTLSVDEALVRHTVGAETFLRGRHYARQGAVRDAKWKDDGQHLFGQVKGSAQRSYTTIAVVEQGSNGAITSFRGTCTCPVGHDCEHSVALLLSELQSTNPVAEQPSAPCAQEKVASWEDSLRDVVAKDPAPDQASPRLALQFDVGEADGRSAPRSLAIRPVVPGSNGGWVRSGISWPNLGQVSYSRRPSDIQRTRLLGELRAMSSPDVYHSFGNRPIQLESIPSRRIWDVLAEAAAAGIPLVLAGKAALPVTVHADTAEIVLEVTREAVGLVMAPRVRIGVERPPLDTVLLVGDPAHGIAWWQELPGCQGRSLRLAALSSPLTARLRRLAEAGRVEIPDRDEPRFLSGYLPALRKVATVLSPDASVDLPEPIAPVLTLGLRHDESDEVSLDWYWNYAEDEGSQRRESLWPSPGTANDREPAIEAAILEQVRAIHGVDLLADSHGGELAASRLTGMDTVRFATELLPQMSELDGVAIESVGTPIEYREADNAPVIAISGEQAAGERDWFDLMVTVAVDGQDVAFETLFTALANEQSHLILPSGTYFALDIPEFNQLAQLIAEARALQDSPSATIRLSRYQASLWDELDRLGVIGGQAAQWQQSVRALIQSAVRTDLAPPASLAASLRPYQLAGFGWLSFLYSNGLGGILADEMGLGKTLQALALICDVCENHLAKSPFLIVAPTSVVANWASECARFAPGLNVVAVTETATRRGSALAEAITEADLVITSYTLFRLEYEQYEALDWAGLVLDEAQFVKNHQSEGYRCAKKLPTGFKLAITGTPMENNLSELWSLLSITAPGLFATPSKFNDHYRVPIERHRNVERLAQLRRRVKPLMLRRAKSDVLLELPDKQEQVVELDLNARHRKVYQTHLQRERQKVLGLLDDFDRNRFEIFRSLTLLRQAALDVSLIDPKHAKVPSTKLDALMEQATEISREGHRTLVFSQFTRFLTAARTRLDAAGIDYCYLDGSTRNRAKVITDFKKGTAPVFLISLKAGGFGLNLTEADYCIVLDPWWNPATEAQAVDRVHRIGQTKKVMVYRLVSKDTIEEKVMALKATKAALFSSVLDDGEFASAALTAADIAGMLE